MSLKFQQIHEQLFFQSSTSSFEPTKTNIENTEIEREREKPTLVLGTKKETNHQFAIFHPTTDLVRVVPMTRAQLRKEREAQAQRMHAPHLVKG